MQEKYLTHDINFKVEPVELYPENCEAAKDFHEEQPLHIGEIELGPDLGKLISSASLLLIRLYTWNL